MSGIDVQQEIKIHLVSDADDDVPETKGWVHTHGLAKFGKPELEIRHVPLFLQFSAARLLNQVADYLLNSGAVVKEGEVMGVDVEGGSVHFRFVKAEPMAGDTKHYQVERWRLDDGPMEHECHGTHGPERPREPDA